MLRVVPLTPFSADPANQKSQINVSFQDDSPLHPKGLLSLLNLHICVFLYYYLQAMAIPKLETCCGAGSQREVMRFLIGMLALSSPNASTSGILFSTSQTRLEVILTSCLVFIWLEFMPNDFDAGLKHLKSRLKILEDFIDQQQMF